MISHFNFPRWFCVALSATLCALHLGTVLAQEAPAPPPSNAELQDWLRKSKELHEKSAELLNRLGVRPAENALRLDFVFGLEAKSEYYAAKLEHNNTPVRFAYERQISEQTGLEFGYLRAEYQKNWGSGDSITYDAKSYTLSGAASMTASATYLPVYFVWHSALSADVMPWDFAFKLGAAQVSAESQFTTASATTYKQASSETGLAFGAAGRWRIDSGAGITLGVEKLPQVEHASVSSYSSLGIDPGTDVYKRQSRLKIDGWIYTLGLRYEF